jgi:rhamnosyltransferase
MRIFGVVVLYEPKSEFLDNAFYLSRFVEKLYLVDNSESRVWGAKQRDFIASSPNVEYIPFGGNKGVAYALNFGAQKALSEGANWLLTMDQDSAFVENGLPVLVDFAQRCDPKRVGIVSPVHWVSGICPLPCEEVVEVLVTMTSGNLVSLQAYKEVGGWREDFFIDSVDHEFCLRLQKRGFKVICYRASVLRHNLGKITRHRFLGREFCATNHNYVRRY